jgi:hypothetical protein
MNLFEFNSKAVHLHSIIHTKECTCTIKPVSTDIKTTSKLLLINGNREIKIAANEYLLGCPICHPRSHTSGKQTNTKTTLKYIKIAKLIHDNKYVYKENSQHYTCTKHGKQAIGNLRDHLLAITPCSQCNTERLRERYIQQAIKSNGSRTTLYLVKLSSNKETFFKVGLTFETVKERFKTVPYDVEEIISITGDVGVLYNLEQNIHLYHKEQKCLYVPINDFSGKSECFLSSPSYINKLQAKIQGYSK